MVNHVYAGPKSLRHPSLIFLLHFFTCSFRIRTPVPISRMAEALPEAYMQFIRNIELLEKHFKDMQDVEFTVENGKLWMLQCRSGKRTGQAAFNIAVDLVKDGICTPQEALLRVEPDHVRQILHPTFSKEAINSAAYRDNVIAVGLSGGPGAGTLYFVMHLLIFLLFVLFSQLNWLSYFWIQLSENWSFRPR